jgi:hypothetical protein
LMLEGAGIYHARYRMYMKNHIEMTNRWAIWLIVYEKSYTFTHFAKNLANVYEKSCTFPPPLLMLKFSHSPIALPGNFVANYTHNLSMWQRMPRFLSESERGRGFRFFVVKLVRGEKEWVFKLSMING